MAKESIFVRVRKIENIEKILSNLSKANRTSINCSIAKNRDIMKSGGNFEISSNNHLSTGLCLALRINAFKRKINEKPITHTAIV